MSEVATDFQVVGPTLADTLLVSAYDIFCKLLPQTDEILGSTHWRTAWALPSILFIDSGGYEIAGSSADRSDLGSSKDPVHTFTRANHREVLGQIPAERDVVAVTWDHCPSDAEPPPYKEQAFEAAELAELCPSFLVDLLLKPPGREKFHDPTQVLHAADTYHGASLIGFTERELGSSLKQRGAALSQIRSGLDDAGVSQPIHVFGVLDPVLVSFYFLCGGEVFDGLTWLRYGYKDGIGVHRDAAALLRGDLTSDSPTRSATTQLAYLAALRHLRLRLIAFTETAEDYSLLGEHSAAIKHAVTSIPPFNERG
jgi:hypothetical protein